MTQILLVRKLFLVCLGLVLMVGYLAVQVVTLRHERRTDWEKSPRTYMLIEAAYYKGFRDCKKSREE